MRTPASSKTRPNERRNDAGRLATVREVFGHRRTFWGATAVVLAAMLGVLALPVRNLVDQQNQLRATEAEVAALEERNSELEARSKALHNPGDLELTARENHGLVFPGEESYSVLPPPQSGQVPGWVSVGLTFDAESATDLVPPAATTPTGSTTSGSTTSGSTTSGSAVEPAAED